MKSAFGMTENGREATLFTLRNMSGMEASFTDFGAAWVSALVPDSEGLKTDVLLGYDDVHGYEVGEQAIGAVVGRVANRTGGASFELNGKVWNLVKNQGENNLHSGPDVYQKRFWEVEKETDSQVVFSLYSPHMDQGFPGALQICVTYTLTDENEVQIIYEIQAEEDTIWNLTNHAYFNLNGQGKGDILNHEVWIDADRITETDENSLPTGEFSEVDKTPMDFRVRKQVGHDIRVNYQPLIYGSGYDHNYVLNGEGYRKAACCISPSTGIGMEVYTDRPGIQLYTGNYLQDEPGKAGVSYQDWTGICFETQNFPDAIHHPQFPNPIILKGEKLTTKTAYRFTVRK